MRAPHLRERSWLLKLPVRLVKPPPNSPLSPEALCGSPQHGPGEVRGSGSSALEPRAVGRGAGLGDVGGPAQTRRVPQPERIRLTGALSGLRLDCTVAPGGLNASFSNRLQQRSVKGRSRRQTPVGPRELGGGRWTTRD